SGSRYASGFSRMDLTNVNMHTVPPMAMPTDRIAVSVKPGDARRFRYAHRRFSTNIVHLPNQDGCSCGIFEFHKHAASLSFPGCWTGVTALLQACSILGQHVSVVGNRNVVDE